ncbi:MAG: hypothetical protein IIW77_04175 [Bacteroidaceae bacterium]|nr:hypothetical protein [Bacteroidaceae bacterium]
MLKKSLRYIPIAVIACYMLYAFVIIPRLADDDKCKELVISISGNELGTINKEEIVNTLKSEGLYPKGIRIDKVSCLDIEKFIMTMSLVKHCQAYKTNDNSVHLELVCREPVLKVYDKKGDIYHVDIEGCKISDIKKPLLLPIASGEIDDSMIGKELKSIALAIKSDPFWLAQIEQIHFNEAREAVIIPRMGDHIIEVGPVNRFEEKLSDIKTFYTNGLNIVGWDKYNKLNVKIRNKVICTEK